MVYRSQTMELIEETAMSPATDAAIRALLCLCFPQDAAAFAETRPWHASAPTYSLLIWDGDALVGHIGIIIRTITAGNTPVVIAGIQNLAVHLDCRQQGMGQRLLAAAMEEAKRRDIPFGLLFCKPVLQPFYAREDWQRIDVDAYMDYEGEQHIPIPGHNIGMVKALTNKSFPAGVLYLQGPDW